jgi:site-specific recombinase XerD
MTALATTLQAFFTDRLIRQRQASPHTCAAYRDTLRLLLVFVSAQKHKQPSQLDIDDLDAPVIGAFLDHLENQRNNGVRTRNARLAAIRSLFRYAALRHPEQAAVIARVLAIPAKRYGRRLVTFLSEPELNALLAAPTPSSPTGRRDRALLALAAQTGLRVSELIGLHCADVHLGAGAHVSCLGKGRKQRVTPLTSGTSAVLRGWLAERAGQPGEPLFATRSGRTLSRDALEHRLAKYVEIAARTCPSLGQKAVTSTCCGIPRRCGCCAPASILLSSRYGLATNRSRRPRCTCTPTSSSRNGLWRRQPQPTSRQAAIGRLTSCSPSSRRSDYADPAAAITAVRADRQGKVGITRRSA